jgi:TolB protein
MIVFTCADCRQQVSVPDELAGTTTDCRSCGRPVDVPNLAAAAALPLAASVRAAENSLADAGTGTVDDAPRPNEEVTRTFDAEITRTFAGAVPDRELYDCLAPPVEPDEIGRLGPFRVLRVLGAGGMGVVYKAEDPRLKRPVALKAMLPILAARESSRKRFVREAKAAAALDHDHIVPIFQVGEDRGVPFLAMQLLEGESLAERLRRQPAMTVLEMVRIGRETALGLAAAHRHGLIHRDVKPANLWLESRPADTFRVKILDFGLARAADDAQLTQSGAIVGTPAYMAPEQAAGEPVDHRVDPFSLGCVLYRLATGIPPFKGKDAIATLVAVARHEPKPPAKVSTQVPAALSDLVMHLLAKKPEERPESAQVVAEALAEIEEALAARTKPRRSRRRAWAALAAVVLVLGIASVMVVQPRTANDGLIGYTELRTDLPGGRHANFSTMRAVVVKADGTGRRILAEELTREPNSWTQFVGWSPDGRTAIVGRSWESPENGRWEEENRRFRMTKEGWLLDQYLVDLADDRATNLTADPRVSFYNSGLFFWPGDPAKLGFAALIGDNSHVFRMDQDGKNKRDLTSQSKGSAEGLTASPDGGRIAYHKGEVYIANADGSEARPVKTGQPFNYVPQWSPDGTELLFLAGVQDHSHPHIVRADGSGLRKLADRGDYHGGIDVLDVPDFHGSSTDFPVWSADGLAVFYTGKHNGNVELFRADRDGKSERLTDTPAGTLHYHPQPSPDGRFLVYGSKRDGVRQLYVMDLGDRKERRLTNLVKGRAAMWPHWQHSGDNQRAGVEVEVQNAEEIRRSAWEGAHLYNTTFSPDGRFYLVGGDTGTLRLYEVNSGNVIQTFVGHAGYVEQAAFTPDGKQILSASIDRTLRLWDIATGKVVRKFEGHDGGVLGVDLTRDGKWAVSGGSDQTLRLWDVSTGKEERKFEGHAKACNGLFTPDGKQIVSYSDRTLRLWDVASGKEVRTFVGHSGGLHGVFPLPDGKRALSYSADKTARIWDLVTGKQVGILDLGDNLSDVRGLALSPDGRRILVGYDRTHILRLMDLETGKDIHRFPLANNPRGLSISPDGRLAACGSFRGLVYLLRLPGTFVVKRTPAP